MSQVNRNVKSTWDGKGKGFKGNKLQPSAWESAIAVLWFVVGAIGAACNYIIKNKKSIADFSYNVIMLSSALYYYINPSKNAPKLSNRRSTSKK